MVVGPTVGYVLQYQEIKRKNSLGAFSHDVCAILIFANLFRIFFWFGKRFEFVLLLQSIFMIIAQLLLLNACIKIKNKGHYQYGKEKEALTTNFWRWHNFETYVQFILVCWGVLSVTTYMFIGSEMYVEFIGYASVIIEACLTVPQIISNLKNKSTEGLNMGLVFFWVFGDTTKTAYFLYKNQPMQFVLCGTAQLMLDFWIMWQIYTYGKQRKPYERLDKMEH